jgi:RimJ/RimL family protein N-acetyltransferase
VRLLVEWGIAELGLERVEWGGIVGNEASRRVAEKVGFRVAGTMRAVSLQPGRRVDLWVGDLLPADLASAPVQPERR